MTPLDKPLRRELEIDGKRYTLTLDASGLRLNVKGHRKGVMLSWSDLVSGDVASGDVSPAVAVQASAA